MKRRVAYLMLLGCWLPVTANATDEPGMQPLLDEPGRSALPEVMAPRLSVVRPSTSLGHSGPTARVKLGFGLSSLVVDPDMDTGPAGGISLAVWFSRYLGAEVAILAAHNPYAGSLGEAGTSFSGGALALGPTVRLTPTESAWDIGINVSPGFYYTTPTVQDGSWTFGLSASLTLGLRVASWFGVGITLRYNLFNIALIGGPELLDLKSLQKVGVVDRLEIPAYVAFYF